MTPFELVCRFKWSNLIEQLNYERHVEEQRLRIELVQARREAGHFIDQVKKGGQLRQMAKRTAEKGGEWTAEKRQDVSVKPPKKKKKKLAPQEQEQLLSSIFA